MKLSGDLDLTGGQLITARMENVVLVPPFQAGRDEGRIVFIESGPDLGYFFGKSDGNLSFQRLNLGTTLVEYDIVAQPVSNGVTFQNPTAASLTPALKGFTAKVTLSANITSGQVTVNLYEDSGFTSLFYSNVFDLSNPIVDNFPSFFELQDVSGDMFIEIINNTGSDGVFTLNVKTAGTLLVQTPPPPGDGSGINAGVAGDGISFDAINLRLDVDLATISGLELLGAAGSRELRILPDPGQGLALTGTGAGVDATVVRTTGNQSIAGIKTFSDSIFGLTPAGSPGAPTTGTHAAGEFFLDSNLDLFQCIVSGTPGTWQFWGFKESIEGGSLVGISYTGTAVATGSVDLVLTVASRRGVFRFLRIWGADPAFGTGDIDVPFRLQAFPNENFEGRQKLWQMSGRVRRVTITAAGAGAGASLIPVTSVGLLNSGDLVRLRQNSGPLEEVAAVLGKNPGGPNFSTPETIANSLVLDDQVMTIVEEVELPVRNNSGIPANFSNIYLRFFNDHPSTDVIFGYEFTLDEIGGGLPV